VSFFEVNLTSKFIIHKGRANLIQQKAANAAPAPRTATAHSSAALSGNPFDAERTICLMRMLRTIFCQIKSAADAWNNQSWLTKKQE
jgi:hypothetical protein